MKHPISGAATGAPTPPHPAKQPRKATPAETPTASPQQQAPAQQQQAFLAAMQDMLLEFDPRLWADSPDEDEPGLL